MTNDERMPKSEARTATRAYRRTFVIRASGFIRHFSLLTAVLCFLLSLPALAASRALIVTGLSGSSSNAEEFQRLAMETKRLLVERGVPVDSVEILDGKVSREHILESIARHAEQLKAEDEFWLVLYGHSGIAAGGVPAFQISGPRLTADDLKKALEAIPARQFVFIGTNSSGGFLPILQDARRSVVAATKGESQSDQPRFPEKWVAAFTENPKAAFTWIAARASALVEEEYKSSSLAQIESARLADPVTGKILEPPFGVNLASAPAETKASSSGGGLITASDIEVKIKDPNAEWEHQPATEQTHKLMEEARAVPNPDGYSAIVLEQKLSLTIEEDRTTDRVNFHRVYLAREEAVDEWANYFLPQSPPAVTTRLQVARVIQPDGSSIAFNPAKLPAGATLPDGTNQTAMVYLPNAHAGCVVELGYRTREILDPTLPHVSEALPIQREVPVLQSDIEVRVPEKPAYRVALKNSASTAMISHANGRIVFHWALDHLGAAEMLPQSPPPSEWQVWLGISSLPSWDDFAAWYRRIAKGSDEINDAVRKTAADLSKDAKSRMEKIQRAFEFVSALRYIAIEFGVHGFRPRTPGQVLAQRYGDCKDKANLVAALLRCMDIDARFVLINRGSATDTSFPSWQFNHAIAFVPKADGQPADLWLDSTDTITPFGFIAPGDYGRDALVFENDKAGFKKVTGTGSDISSITDDWELTEDASGGAWTGAVRRRAAGLADYAMRATFRSLTPGQRRHVIYKQLDSLWPAGEFREPTLSDVSQLREGVELRAKVSGLGGETRSLPRAEFPWLDAFSSPERNRPLLLNDGQQFSGKQTVRLHFVKPTARELPPPLSLEAAGETLQVTWQKLDEQTLERVAQIDFKKPAVSASDYPALRKAVRVWMKMTNSE